MEHDIPAFFMFGAIGLVCGVPTALFFRRSPHRYIGTIFGSFIIATLFTLVFFFGMDVASNMTQHGDSLGRAVQETLNKSIIVLLIAPVACGVPAVLFGVLAQFATGRAKQF